MATIQMTQPRPDRSSRPQRRTLLLLPLAILSLLLLVLAGCGTTASRARATAQGSVPPAGPAATAPVPCPPAGEGAPPSCPPCPPAQGQLPTLPPCLPCPPAPPTAPPTCFPCPPDREAPCPVVSPQPSPTPRLGQPVIIFCPTPPAPVQVAPGAIQLQGFVCGRGFHPAELVTLTASGPRGRLVWQLRADRDGTFMSPLPPLLCRLVPLALIASGNEGSRSNTLTLGADACLPTA
jgi:hypothetical protein